MSELKRPDPHFSHLLVMKGRKGRPDKARDLQAGTDAVEGV
jgi:hypothetical protein